VGHTPQPGAPAADLTKRGLRCRCIQRKLVSHDPQRPTILARIRSVFHHLPQDGVLVVFAVKPIVVKAYGGRRYTSAKRLVLERPQKTRGKFHLFATDAVGTGRTRWAFRPAKAAPPVCPFMKRVRQWYPEAAVWGVLDQDGAHPRQSKLTRRPRRELKLRWISLPTGSPDDHPVETLFSDLRLMILDTSNDADSRTLQRRIGRYLHQRNRRGNRFIRVAYLGDSHKN
jgi:hypothetical protein